MADRSLETAVTEAGSPLELLSGGAPFPWPEEPDVYTNWIEEQRAWREGCGLRNHTPVNPFCRFEGPEAVDLLADFGVNGFTDFGVGQAKQYVACSPSGDMIGDMIVFRLDERSYALTGIPEVANWLRYNLEVEGYDVSTNFEDAYALTADRGSRDRFRYSIQGPTAVAVMRDVVDGSIPDIPFFQFRDVTIAGRDCSLFHHGMAGETGYEFWGPHDAADEVWDAVVEAGREHGLRRIGNRSYQTMSIESGWMPGVFPAIFGDHDRLRGYRDWIDADLFTRLWSPGGSFAPDDVSAFYLDPVEAGYGHLIDFDHAFLGRDALVARTDEEHREKVTLVWNDDDVVDVYRTLFGDVPAAKFMDVPILWWTAAFFDEVVRAAETVGVSKIAGYSYNERTMLSLAVIDEAVSAPGTDVTITWGQRRETSNPAVERHEPTEIRATVAPVPYVEDRHGRGN